MVSKIEYICLNNNQLIPMIAIGPGILNYGKRMPDFGNSFLNKCYSEFNNRILSKFSSQIKYVNSVSHAIDIGYRLIDNSASYRNEKLIGRAIRKSGINREEMFITSRVSNKQQLNGSIRNFFMQSLNDLGVSYIDLYMFHWPVTDCYLNTWRQMVELYEEGLIKTLGVANCHQHHLEEIFKISDVVPAINQIEVHPLFTQKPLIEFCKSKGIQVESYTPIARNDDRLVRSRLLKELGKKYNKTVQQIILRWHIQNGLIPVIRSHNKRRQLQNISVFDFNLTPDELTKIDSLNLNSRLRYDPDNCDFSIL